MSPGWLEVNITDGRPLVFTPRYRVEDIVPICFNCGVQSCPVASFVWHLVTAVICHDGAGVSKRGREDSRAIDL